MSQSNDRPIIQMNKLDLTDGLSGLFQTLEKQIDNWELKKKCRCSSLRASIENILKDIKKAADLQFNEITQLRVQTGYYENRLHQLLEAKTNEQVETHAIIEKQKQQLDDQINRFEHLLGELRSSSAAEHIAEPASFADVVRRQIDAIPPESAPPVILIDAIDSKTQSTSIRDKVKKLAVDDAIKLKPKDIYLTQRNRLVLTMEDRSEAETIAKQLSNKLPQTTYKVTLPRIQRKRLNILRVPIGISTDQLLQAIMERTNTPPEHCQLAFEYPDHQGVRTVSWEVDHKTYVRLLQHPRLCIEFIALQIAPYVRIVRCQNCQRYGHFARSCREPQVCASCSGGHRTAQCKSKEPLCVNCHHEKLPCSHKASDSSCSIFRSIRDELLKKEWAFAQYPPGTQLRM